MSHTTRSTATPTRSARHGSGVVGGLALVAAALVGLTGCGLPSGGVVATGSQMAQVDVPAPATPDGPTTTEPGTTEPGTTEPGTNEPATVVPVSVPPLTLPTVPTIPTAPTIPSVTTPGQSSVPLGAVDLGDGVFVQIAPGWSANVTNGLARLTDGTIDVLLEVVRRPPGESPATVIDEYVGLNVDPAADVVSYTPATLRWSTQTPRPIAEYGLFYRAASAADLAGGIDGGLSIHLRDDGLTLVYDVWAPVGVAAALPDTSFQSLIDSFEQAPQAATPAALPLVDDFRVATAHRHVTVNGLAGYAVAPGFEVFAEQPDLAVVHRDGASFGSFRVAGVADSAAALAQATATVRELHPDAMFTDEVRHEPNALGLVQHTVRWTAGDRSGDVTVVFDPTTSSAFALSANARTDLYADPAIDAAFDFMWSSMLGSFSQVP